MSLQKQRVLFFLSDQSCAQPDNSAKGAKPEPRNEVTRIRFESPLGASCLSMLIVLAFTRSSLTLVDSLSSWYQRHNDGIQQIYSRICLGANKYVVYEAMQSTTKRGEPHCYHRQPLFY